MCRWRPAETGPEEAASAADALAVLRRWAPRLAASLLAAIALGAGMAVFQPPDNALFLAVNGLGDGPDWLYPALDPHTRNYILLFLTTLVASALALRRPRYVLGATLGFVLAAYLAGAAIEVVKLYVERARPEEVIRDQLSDAELRVVRYLPSNLTASEIASELVVSANTVRTHMRHIYAKLGAHSRSEAVARARELGLVAPGALRR